MYIKQLEIDNFKSFANKMDIPLLEGFTTISGPNGSGKSNIIDSVLFALGLSTSRTLRAEKLFHLISTHTKRNEATVKVTFGGLADSSEDLSIARRIRKSSSGYVSTYFMNDKTVTLTEVHTVLENYNITPNSYNVVMQGDVLSITNCSPNERRKIIDEIAGVADFDRRIDQAKEKLDEVEGRVEKATFILNEVESNLERLVEEKEVAEKYKRLKDEQTELKSQINAVTYFDIKRNIETAHENILDGNKKKKEKENEYADIEDRLKLVKTKYDEICEQVKAKGEAEQLELQRKAEEIKGAINMKNSAINYAEKEIINKTKAIENAQNGIENQKKKIVDTNLKIELKQEEVKSIEDSILDKREELNKVLAELTGKNETAEKFMEKHSLLRNQLAEYQDKENDLLKEKYPKESRLENLRKELENSERELAELTSFRENYSSNKDKIQVQHEELGKEIEDLKRIQRDTLNELESVKSEISDDLYKIQMGVKKVAELEATKSAMSMNSNAPVEAVMKARLQGVHAPLMDLGKVDKEYSTALEVAMGARMTHIVVDDDYVATTAIELLKSAHAGRATFIPLNKINQAPNSLRLPKDKGVIDYAINLIDFDEEYIDAFYYALGETLVVENQDAARKLIGKYRMVTLAGEIFEKSGSISGGSLKANRLKFSQNDDEELKRYKDRLKELEEHKAKLEQKRADLEAKLEKTRETYNSSVEEFNKTRYELNNLENSNSSNDSKLTKLQDFINSAKPEIEKLEKELDKAEEKEFGLSEKILEIKGEIDELENLMNDSDLKNLKGKTADIEAEIKRLDDKLRRAMGDIDDFNRQINFDKSIIDVKYKDIDNFNKEIETLKADIRRYNSDADELKKQLEEKEEQIEKINVVLGSLFKERDEIQAELLEFEKKKNISQSEIEKITEQIESFKARRRELEPKLEEARTALEQNGIDVKELAPVTISIDEINAKIARLQRKMDDLGDVNMKAITDYDRVLRREQELKAQIETLTQERLQILERMNGFEQDKKEAFLKTYNNININFKEVFHDLSSGEGTLVLENEEDPLNGGLTIDAQTRDKDKKQRLESMSGGEKTLTALAFVFAIQRYLPAPFYALDEVDANLDGINVEKLANIIQTQSKDTQFIVVSHRKPMIESANRTIGVTQKEKGITKVTGVKLRD